MIDLSTILNPPGGLAASVILAIAFILGTLHGITPDEHTWPITFSYSLGSYTTRGGMKSGFMFSLGFTTQRAILTALGFLGLAAFYNVYHLDGPIYIIVGLVMFIAGSYILKGKYLHLPMDWFLGRKSGHHTTQAERIPLHEIGIKPVPLRMATVHGLIAGWGFGAYASIITFILAPEMPNVIYALLVGGMFGIGTMCMQIIIGAVFANMARIKKLTMDQVKYVGRSAAARTLYLGGLAFAMIGILLVVFPILNQITVNTGNPIPDLNSIGVATVLVIFVVGVIGFGSIYRGFRELKEFSSPRLPTK